MLNYIFVAGGAGHWRLDGCGNSTTLWWHRHFPQQVPELRVGPRAKSRSLKELLEWGILNLLGRGFLRSQLGFKARFPPGSRPSCPTQEHCYESHGTAEAGDDPQGRSLGDQCLDPEEESRA